MTTAGYRSMLEDLDLVSPHLIFCGEAHLTASTGKSAPLTKCSLRGMAKELASADRMHTVNIGLAL